MLIKSIELKSIRRISETEQLNMSRFNIFIGQNGSGKSTLIDSLHGLSSSEKLVNLVRENLIPNKDYSYIKIYFEDDSYLYIRFYNDLNTATDTDKYNVVFKYFEVDSNQEELLKDKIVLLFDKKNDLEDTYKNEITTFIQKNLSLNIVYINEKNFEELTPETIVKSFNELIDNFEGILNSGTKREKYPMAEALLASKNVVSYNKEKNKYSIMLNDDLFQSNCIKFDYIPSGWKSLIYIFSIIKKIKRNTIYLLEEPETNLHPKLQRVLLEKIFSVKKAQFFIATHSPIFINTIEDKEVSIFETKTNTINLIYKQNSLLNSLGIKASDMNQSNGIIWIEGPSDRIYIKKWLELWCKKTKKKIFIENIHYSFSMYGGSILSHFTSNEENEFINMLKINRNIFIVIDNDNELKYDTTLNRYEKRGVYGETKLRIIDELNSLSLKNNYWVTKQYTIESYLPNKLILKNFNKDNNQKLILKENKNKVRIAMDYSKEKRNFRNKDDLEEQIKKLYNCINSWSNL